MTSSFNGQDMSAVRAYGRSLNDLKALTRRLDCERRSALVGPSTWRAMGPMEVMVGLKKNSKETSRYVLYIGKYIVTHLINIVLLLKLIKSVPAIHKVIETE